MEIAKILEQPGRLWRKLPPACESAIERVQQVAPAPLPSEYCALLRYTNGGDGPIDLPPLWFMLYEAEFVAEINSSATQRELYPDHFVFGSNGGLETIAFTTATSRPWPIVMHDGVASIESDIVIASDMATFIQALGLEYKD